MPEVKSQISNLKSQIGPALSERSESNGFTLIELMVSITIIGVLLTTSAISYQSIQQRGRDGRRQADLKVVQGMLQQYYADSGFYPLLLSSLTSPRAYLKTVPVDPSTGVSYLYQPAAGCDNVVTKCHNYCLATQLENSSNAPTSMCTVSGGNYGVAPP